MYLGAFDVLDGLFANSHFFDVGYGNGVCKLFLDLWALCIGCAIYSFAWQAIPVRHWDKFSHPRKERD